MTSPTSSGATPAWARAASIAVRPNSCAGTLAKAPRKAPTGVRLAAAMTTSVGAGIRGLLLTGRAPIRSAARKPVLERLPQSRPRPSPHHHSDMAEREVDPCPRPGRARRRHDPVDGRDDLEHRAGEGGRIRGQPFPPTGDVAPEQILEQLPSRAFRQRRPVIGPI